MTKVIFNMSMSIDGYITDPNDDTSQLHNWYFAGDTDLPGTPFKISKASVELMTEASKSIGSMVTGKRTFDISEGWGGHPPLGVPHFVLTHNPVADWEKEGSPFTTGIEDAIARAKKEAGQKHVCISSANILQQALTTGLVDELHIDLVHVLLSDGKALFANTPQPKLECVRTVEGKGVTHLAFKVAR